uniref:Uncharacterized protein n=1 Tax=Globisporangium ultimum (strain ATCC 200006 / CBS 805.95 / DAOM BR144) TaxID=431595 RepID=K3W764_GLOUD
MEPSLQQQQEMAPARGSVDALPAESTQKMIHTRSCNKREICSCFLRLQSAYFQKNLASKKKRIKAVVEEKDGAAVQAPSQADVEALAAKEMEAMAGAKTRRRTAVAVVKAEVQLTPPKKKKTAASRRPHYRVVTNLQLFDIEVKQMIAACLLPVDIAKLSMVSRTMKADMETVAERGTREFVSAPSRTEIILKDTKRSGESWARYLHLQMNCVYQILVYYTGYKTAQMRHEFAHWTFGVVSFDPNDPAQVILPNTWKFHQHEPWIRRRANGKGGEWLLKDSYKRGRASKAFGFQVKEWAMTLRPGSFVAVAYQNAGSEEPAWWEAQVWYAWRAKGQAVPVDVYDSEHDTTMQVHPDDLLEHFK